MYIYLSSRTTSLGNKTTVIQYLWYSIIYIYILIFADKKNMYNIYHLRALVKKLKDGNLLKIIGKCIFVHSNKILFPFTSLSSALTYKLKLFLLINQGYVMYALVLSTLNHYRQLHNKESILQTVSTAWRSVRSIQKALSGSGELDAIGSVPSGM